MIDPVPSNKVILFRDPCEQPVSEVHVERMQLLSAAFTSSALDISKGINGSKVRLNCFTVASVWVVAATR